MDKKLICGTDFERMLRGGLYVLRQHEQEINDLNVFPVPDGDTGTNMRLTLENALRTSPSRRPTGAYLKGISDGMLLGARGNSGVILSQIFKGIFLELCHYGSINAPELRDALVRGYKTAYGAVMKPAEGTLLTVSREGVENIRARVTREMPVDRLLALYLSEMKKSLARTPELLPVLAEAGVVDSGAKGYIILVEGMFLALRGELKRTEREKPLPQTAAEPVADTSLFNAWSPFTDGYCLEFVLQLMKSAEYSQKYHPDRFREDLGRWGGSLAAVQSGDRVKIHIHTFRPEKVISLAREYGEFISFKLENMQLQHSVRDARVKKAPRSRFARVSVANAPECASIFRELGCEEVISGGKAMNVSAQEFIEAFERVNADEIAVLPNNRNTYGAALQAASLYTSSRITVLETGSVAEGYYALAMDVPDSDDAEYRLAQMREGVSRVTVFSAARASRDSALEGIPIAEGQVLVFRGHAISAVGNEIGAALGDAFRKAAGEGCDFETVMVFCDAKEDERETLQKEIAAVWPCAETVFFAGGPSVYRFIIGAV